MSVDPDQNISYNLNIIRMIWRGYAYFFYRIYAFELKFWGESSAKWAAMYLAALVSWFNLLTLMVCICAPFGGEDYILNRPKSTVVLGLIFWLWLNYKALLSRGKYKSIIAGFSEESVSARKRNTWLCLLYPILSFAVMTLAAIYV